MGNYIDWLSSYQSMAVDKNGGLTLKLADFIILIKKEIRWSRDDPNQRDTKENLFWMVEIRINQIFSIYHFLSPSNWGEEGFK